jgi:hypothetical protein
MIYLFTSYEVETCHYFYDNDFRSYYCFYSSENYICIEPYIEWFRIDSIHKPDISTIQITQIDLPDIISIPKFIEYLETIVFRKTLDNLLDISF